MQIPLQISFHRMASSPAVETRIREKVAKLERLFDQILSCRVSVEAPHGHHHKGKLYRVRILLKVPHEEFAISREHHDNHAHEDLYVAMRDAFDAARRRLAQYAWRRRGAVKFHREPPEGWVSLLAPEQDYGTIETAEGRLIYFHRNSVLDEAFERLQVGSRVCFVEEAGLMGPQASSVRMAQRRAA